VSRALANGYFVLLVPSASSEVDSIIAHGFGVSLTCGITTSGTSFIFFTGSLALQASSSSSDVTLLFLSLSWFHGHLSAPLL
jgi:hypothetical protein